MEGKTGIIAKFHKTDLLISSHSRERKPVLELNKYDIPSYLELYNPYLPYFFGYKTEFFFLPKQFQSSRSVLQDGSRSLILFRKGKIGIIAKFHRTNLVI